MLKDKLHRYFQSFCYQGKNCYFIEHLLVIACHVAVKINFHLYFNNIIWDGFFQGISLQNSTAMLVVNKKVEAISEFFRLLQQYVTKKKTAKNSAETFIYILCWQWLQHTTTFFNTTFSTEFNYIVYS